MDSCSLAALWEPGGGQNTSAAGRITRCISRGKLEDHAQLGWEPIHGTIWEADKEEKGTVVLFSQKIKSGGKWTSGNALW